MNRNITRLPSNLRPTTRECVHLGYAWSLTVTWQRWRSHHWTRYSHQNPHVTQKLHVSMFYRTGVIAALSYSLRKYEFSTFLYGSMMIINVIFVFISSAGWADSITGQKLCCINRGDTNHKHWSPVFMICVTPVNTDTTFDRLYY